MEANCHFLEFSRFENGSARQLLRRSYLPTGVGILHPKRRLGGTLPTVAAELVQELGFNPVTVPKSNPMPSLAGAECQPVAKQVLLYCFRVSKCGTFMPLSRVRGEFRIAVVWTRIVAAFSAISPVHFRFCSHTRFSLSVVGCR